MRVKQSWFTRPVRLIFAYLFFLAGCASTPEVVPIHTTATPIKAAIKPASDYQEILDAITSVMWADLELPPAEGVVTFYPNRFALESALAQHFTRESNAVEEQWLGAKSKEAFRAKLWSGFSLEFEKKIESLPEPVKDAFRAKATAEFDVIFEKEFERLKQTVRAKMDEDIAFAARQRAVTVVAITGHGQTIVNELIIRRYSWPDRVKTLAHELTHLVQQRLIGNGPASVSLPAAFTEFIEKGIVSGNVRPSLWLTEGFAEWVGYKVLDALKIQTMAKSREYALGYISAARQYQTFPSLAQLVSDQDWRTWTANLGFAATYGQAFLAVETLIRERSSADVVSYFNSFATSKNREQSFATAFGAETLAFEGKFDSQLRTLLGK